MERAWILPAIFLAAAAPASAADAAGSGGPEFHGSVQANYASRLGTTRHVKPASGDLLLGEERLQLQLSGTAPGGAGYFTRTDFLRDETDGQSAVELREAYLTYAKGSLNLRAGRQTNTWGVGDLLFINDLFPKNYAALFSGRPMEYLKTGAGSLKTSFYSDKASLDLVATPVFEPDQFPAGQRFFLFDPFSQVTNRVDDRPRHDLGNMELAARLTGPVLGFDAALYAYRGFFRTPSMVPDSMTAPTVINMTYPRLSACGASLQGNAAGGVLSLEAGFYDSRQDRAGTDPVIPNSQTRFLAGYQRTPWTDFTAGLQYYGEYMHRYARYSAALPAGFPKQDRLRQLLTLRLTQFLKYQTWKLSMFSFWSPTDKDFYLIPEAAWRATDELTATVGSNVFGGASRNTFLGQLDRNDNLYVSLRYEF